MDPCGNFYDPSHNLVALRHEKFSLRIGTNAGIDRMQSERIIGEGLTLFYNKIPLSEMEWNNDEEGIRECSEARSLHHLELEVQAFLPNMPVKPHTDRKNCPHPNFDILACTSKCLKLPDGSYARMGGLLYFRDVCSHFVSREEIGDIIEWVLQSKMDELPIQLKEVLPHVPRLLNNSTNSGGIFSSPPHLDKCMYFSILVDQINHVSRVHRLTLMRRIELCSIVLATNGMDLPWSILTRWGQTKDSLPTTNLFLAFVNDAMETNNGTLCSNGKFRRSVPSINTLMALPQVLYMHQV
jgi:hypothetical protein